ncbi:endonuclease/exonuclease/phosphatase family protein [Desulfosediminicola ganghwensis]|uniref:endonuclease/exonuclease/phosphatase family protein n=1 Tax=Desulfosediminicola ganghwensis TaxID=2569540 RepID=UPI0010AC22C7|nr:endonuclease/exonuclease/phosphatase family protein [Desulfosediminicola ganghwensis]
MRILLYNIRYATGHLKGYHKPFPFIGFFKRTEVNLQRIINFIRSVDPDIIGLIEVDSGSYRSRKTCQAEEISNILGYNCIAETKYSEKSLAQKVPILNRQSNALLTRERIHDNTFHYFREGVKRLIIKTELEEAVIFLVHLSLKYRHRQHQLEYLHTLVRRTKKEVIVAGDFNTFFGSRELKLFLAASNLESANIENIPSHPSHSPHRQIDFILHSPGISIDNFYIPDVRLSDHSPLICDFSFKSSVAAERFSAVTP